MPLLFGALILAGWYAARPIAGLSRFSLPYPHEVLGALIRNWGEILPAAGRTLATAGAGFLAALAAGMAAALLMAWRATARAMLYPWVLVLQMTPLVVLIPLIVLWMDGFSSVLFIAFLIAFFPITASAVQGLLSADPAALEFFHLHRATWWQQMWMLRLPGALPYILTGAQISASLAIVGALTGEMFAGEVSGGRGGLGYWIILYRAEGDTAAMLGAGLAACVMGFLFVGAVQLLRLRLLGYWHESFSTRQEDLQRLR
ncbi:MAG: ABC transporter permease subunit [Opitutales bacterium]|jgi:NitT/TauT family transport system permease protein